MNALVASLAVFSLAPAYDLPTTTWQLVPAIEGDFREPKVTKTKAVICIPGLYPHPIRPEKALLPEKHPWFEPDAPLLKALAADFDIYGIGYAQTVPVDAVALSNGMRDTVEKLRAAGYREIVLIGHSAGGLIGYQFAQCYPKSGVTKVIPVSAPYAGSELAELGFGLPRTQVAYIKSMLPQTRLDVLSREQPMPAGIEVCCVMCKISRLPNDFMVSLSSQWPPEIRRQGIPATLVSVNHFDAMEASQGVSTIAELAKSRLIRWGEADVAKATKIIFGKEADAVARPRPGRRDRPILRKLGDLLEERFINP